MISPTVIFNPSRQFVWSDAQQSPLPVLDPDRVKRLFREIGDDLPPNKSLWGIDPSIISLSGYKICRVGYHGVIDVPRGSVIVPVKSPSGQIVALHDGEGNWFTAPKVHTVNLIRRVWTTRLEVFGNTIEADAAAISHNVAAIGLNGFEFRQLSANLVGFNPKIVSADRLERAA